MRHYFGKVHLIAFAVLLAAFTGFTFWLVMNLPPGDWNDWQGVHPYRATLLAVSGPFTGGILRPFEPSCWRIAWSFSVWCLPVLLVAFLLQFVRMRFKGGEGMIVWVCGWLVWFGAGFVALVCAVD